MYPISTLYPKDDLGHTLANIRNHLVVEQRESTDELRKSATCHVLRYGVDTLISDLDDRYYEGPQQIKWGDAFVAAGILTLRVSSSQPAHAEHLRRIFRSAQTDQLAAHAVKAGVHGLINAINEQRLPFGERANVRALIRRGVLSVNVAALGGGR